MAEERKQLTLDEKWKMDSDMEGGPIGFPEDDEPDPMYADFEFEDNNEDEIEEIDEIEEK